VILLLTPGICLSAGYGETGKAGDYSIVVTWDKSRPALGPNRVEIAVTDAASQPVTGAEVKIDYLMPSLPGKPAMMGYSTTATPVDGRYEATINLTMKGLWRMVVSVTAGQHAEKATSTFEVK
jgi:nitrogen fixation protein FixH